MANIESHQPLQGQSVALAGGTLREASLVGKLIIRCDNSDAAVESFLQQNGCSDQAPIRIPRNGVIQLVLCKALRLAGRIYTLPWLTFLITTLCCNSKGRMQVPSSPVPAHWICIH